MHQGWKTDSIAFFWVRKTFHRVCVNMSRSSCEPDVMGGRVPDCGDAKTRSVCQSVLEKVACTLRGKTMTSIATVRKVEEVNSLSVNEQLCLFADTKKLGPHVRQKVKFARQRAHTTEKDKQRRKQ